MLRGRRSPAYASPVALWSLRRPGISVNCIPYTQFATRARIKRLRGPSRLQHADRIPHPIRRLATRWLPKEGPPIGIRPVKVANTATDGPCTERVGTWRARARELRFTPAPSRPATTENVRPRPRTPRSRGGSRPDENEFRVRGRADSHLRTRPIHAVVSANRRDSPHVPNATLSRQGQRRWKRPRGAASSGRSARSTSSRTRIATLRRPALGAIRPTRNTFQPWQWPRGGSRVPHAALPPTQPHPVRPDEREVDARRGKEGSRVHRVSTVSASKAERLEGGDRGDVARTVTQAPLN